MTEPTISTNSDIDHLTPETIELVTKILLSSNKLRTKLDQSNKKRFARLLKDPASVELTILLTDQVMRVTSSQEAAKILRLTAQKASVKGLGLLDYLGIKAASLTSYLLPQLTINIVKQRVRKAATGIILPAEKTLLGKHIEKRNLDNANLNINLLGEAILGDLQANQRLNALLDLVGQENVNYASVKISSIVSQLITIDLEGSINLLAPRLRLLYATAQKAKTFINLDMEEYRDQALTIALFKKILSEPQFESLNAGIVLQAYLPESHAAFADLVTWAKIRYDKTGGTIKIRIVKGANLAMEKAEAQIHGWVPAPYSTKSQVDASYARLIDTALRPEIASAVRIGIASHNLFHLAWALQVAKARNVTQQIDLEMLEGMANAEALSLAQITGSLLLYTPVTSHENFPNAVAYLVRRLDENTSLENYLRASFDIAPGNEKFEEQKQRFINSIKQRHHLSTQSIRHQKQLSELDTDLAFKRNLFINEKDSDPTDPEFVKKLQSAIEKQNHSPYQKIPLLINGDQIYTEQTHLGKDPNNNGKPWYEYSVANQEQIEKAIQVATLSYQAWDELGAPARATILARAAVIMQSERVQTIALMMQDAGKTFSEADPEITEAIDFARYYALSAQEKQADSTPQGTVLVLPPWNFPYAIPVGGVCAALAAGNSVILKPAPETVATAYQIVKQLHAAGVPKSNLQLLCIDENEHGQFLITHENVNALILTGSFETASLFTSWKPDLNLMAETSGKNAILISSSADLDQAVKDLVHSAFSHAGQKCSAASLAIVEKTIYENPEFLAQLKDAVNTLTTGPGHLAATTVGPLINPPNAKLFKALTSLEEGETWLVEPKQLPQSPYLYSPGVKLGVKPGSWSHRTEWFGPVLALMKAPDFLTAIKWQNDTDYGLTAGLQALSLQQCQLWVDNIQAGNLYINRTITGAVVHRQPFGGIKRSTVGPTHKAGGPNYLNNLRNYSKMHDLAQTKQSSKRWWENAGSKAQDLPQLQVEKNYQRYLPYPDPIIAVVDENTPPDTITYLNFISKLINTQIKIVTTSQIPSLTIYPPGQKLRWLAQAPPPFLHLQSHGVNLDVRPLAARGDIETPRWLQEQSISITNHRYGNIGASPTPQL